MRRLNLLACVVVASFPMFLAACEHATPSRAGRLLTIAGEEANLIDTLDDRLTRQLNIADMQIQAGQKVLVNGASGGVGTFAVQIAKAMGAEVTGVCSTRNVDLVKSIGADHVIDYTKEDFTKGDQRYDVIFDNVQNHSFSERRRVLTPNGICVLAGIGGAGWHADTGTHIARSFSTPMMSKFTSQKFKFFIAELNHNDLAYLADLMQSGKLKPVIDRTYKSLSETPQALAYLEEGHARGKVVIGVE